MASYKEIFALILIIKWIETSSAARPERQIVPLGTVINAPLKGKGKFLAPWIVPSIATATFYPFHTELERIDGVRREVTVFTDTIKSPRGEVIAAVYIKDVETEQDRTLGGTIELIGFNAEYTDVTLRFSSKKGAVIAKHVMLLEQINGK